jgi:hypothetical protein
VLIYGTDPDDLNGNTRVLAVSKANYAQKQALKVRVQEVAVDGVDKLQAKAELAGASNYTDQDVSAATSGATGRTPRKKEAAERLIHKLLEDGGGEIDADTAYLAGDAAGISRTTMREAREQIGVSGGARWASVDQLAL